MFFIGFRDGRVHSLIFLVVAAPAKRAEDDPSRLTARAATGIPKRSTRPPARSRRRLRSQNLLYRPLPVHHPGRYPALAAPPPPRYPALTTDGRKAKRSYRPPVPGSRPPHRRFMRLHRAGRPIEQTSMERDRRAEFCQRRSRICVFKTVRKHGAGGLHPVTPPPPPIVRDVGASARNAIFEDSVA